MPSLPAEPGELTETESLRTQLALAQEELESAKRDLRLMAGLSHDLRTPLTSMQGFLTTLLAEDLTWSPEEQREFLQIIARELKTFTDLTFNMVDLAALRAETLRLRMSQQAIEPVVEQVREELVTLAGMNAIYWQVDQAVPAVLTDPLRLQQVLRNLLAYLAKTLPPGSGIHLGVSPAGQPGPGVYLTLRDMAQAVPEQSIRGSAILAQLTASDRTIRSAVLLLVVAAGLAQSMGGELYLSGPTPPWRCFQIWLPAC